jgi:hypothetical protein
MGNDQTSSGAAQVRSQALRELADGLAFWDSRRAWGRDLGNADYAAWANENPHGAFTLG